MDILHYVNGDLRPSADARWLDNHEPATGAVYARIADAGNADLDAAVGAARQAFPAWSRTSAEERARWLHQLAASLETRMDEFAQAESRDNGKPVSLARNVDIPRAVANLRFYAAAATQFASEAHAMAHDAINYTLRQPLGVVGCISPWNLPLYLFTWKIAPALAAGNCVVAKPSEITPYTAYLFSELCRDTGLPPGVLNVLHGRGAEIGQQLVEHPAIKAVSFTGGTHTGARIAASAAPLFKKLSLELGGKNASIVFADCDFDRTVRETLRAAFSNQGEICLCGSRILVERSLYDGFRDAFVAQAGALRVGDPQDTDTDQGALVSEPHMNKVLGCIEKARAEGGRILTGGERVQVDGRCANGWFVAPSVIEGLDAGSRTNQEEIFGPVVTLIPFDDDTDAVAMANATRYGLAGSVWTQDIGRAHRVAAAVDAGLLWVNCWMLRDLRVPMGGMKDSGVGREGGFDALRFFTEAKNVCVKY